MCTYSASSSGDEAGTANDFHLGHYYARAAGGAGLIMIEATAVSPEGRISPYDLGLWSDQHIAGLARITRAVGDTGAKIGIQLAHAGRKASTDRPQSGGAALPDSDGGWEPVAPSSLTFPHLRTPHALSLNEIDSVIEDFGRAAGRAHQAGFDAIEIHAAHGYLIHEFLSPVTNQRTDTFGGSFENRVRFLTRIVETVKNVWPTHKPIFVRISTTDWIAEDHTQNRESWTVDDSLALLATLTDLGVDLIDCSSGGTDIVPIPHTIDYQTRYAARLKAAAGETIAIGAVGRITEPQQAQDLIALGKADVVFIGRGMLRDISWANNAATKLASGHDVERELGRGALRELPDVKRDAAGEVARAAARETAGEVPQDEQQRESSREVALLASGLAPAPRFPAQYGARI